MSIDTGWTGGTPDYELEARRTVTDRRSVTAMFHPLRGTILDLLLERAATVSELAEAMSRPPSTVAYHVDVLANADLVRVVRTRKVRAVTERFYGRTARTFTVGTLEPGVRMTGQSPIADAAAEAEAAHRNDDLRAIHRRARIPAERIPEFWERVLELADEFGGTERTGPTTHAFIAGLYPTEFPTLPEPGPESSRIEEL